MFEEEKDSVEEQTLEVVEESAELEDSDQAMEEAQEPAAVESDEPEADLEDSEESTEAEVSEPEAEVESEQDEPEAGVEGERDEPEAGLEDSEESTEAEVSEPEAEVEGEQDEPEAGDEGEQDEPEAEVEVSEPNNPEVVDTLETAGAEEDAIEVEEIVVADDDREWFVVHCYSGYENKVRHNLENRIETMNMKDQIFDVVVPTEEEMEVKNGKRRTVERRVFPGYILVQMLMNEDSWYVVRNTPGVTGFVGMGNEPTPLRPEEVEQIIKRMEAEAPRIKVSYKVGQKVRIIDGP